MFFIPHYESHVIQTRYNAPYLTIIAAIYPVYSGYNVQYNYYFHVV